MSKGNALMLVVVAVVMLASSHTVASLEDDQTRQHVIGEDRGWDPASDVASWASGKVFSVGDSLWFSYSAAQEVVAELGSKEEFETCDVSNPIRMYTDGLNSVNLDGEGSRYFVSGMPESCKDGLKLHVHVVPSPQQQLIESNNPMSTTTVMAVAPAPPSSTTPELPVQLSALLLVGFALHLYYLAF
ncbi:hypothetical protein MKW94_029401 [Papaver nudicaule]|uniref:Phytocyanin domain-containing protein n=1 Tax=Papaver nudicaule TaxID=74823 RepID=A0AA41V544_PAPNU|nr:hypothetical protein [Papaver nudicaule]